MKIVCLLKSAEKNMKLLGSRGRNGFKEVWAVIARAKRKLSAEKILLGKGFRNRLESLLF